MTAHHSRRGHLVTDLAEALRGRLARGEFSAGERIPSEAELTAAYGVSRTVVREAVAALRADGLIESRQGSGVYALDAKPSHAALFKDVDFARISSVVEMLELRMAVESEAAALAAVRRSPQQEEKIVEKLRRLLNAPKGEVPAASDDLALHLAIAEASNNPRFSEFLHILGEYVIPRRALQPEETARPLEASFLPRINQEHQQIVDAILQGDARRARQAMRRHLEGGLSRYRRYMRSHPTNTG